MTTKPRVYPKGRPKLTEDETADVLRLLDEGMKPGKVGKLKGITRQRVWQIRKAAEAYANKQPDDVDYNHPDTPEEVDVRVSDLVFDDTDPKPIRQYSTVLGFAEHVLHFMRGLGYQVQMHSYDPGGLWWVEFAKNRYKIGGQATGHPLARVICEAAIEARLCEAREG